MTEEEFLMKFREILRAELKSFLVEVGDKLDKLQDSQRTEYLPISEVCHRLGITVQTFYNWKKDTDLNDGFLKCKRNIGKRALYNYEGLKRVIGLKKPLFCMDKDFKP